MANDKPTRTFSPIWLTLGPLLVFLLVLLFSLLLIKNYYGDLTAERDTLTSIKSGALISEFEFTTLTDKKISSQSFKDKILLLNFWASWCHPCITEIPSLVQLQKKYQDQGLHLALINIDEKPKVIVPRTLPQLGVDFETYYDFEQKLSDLFDVQGVPLTIALSVAENRKMKVLYIEAGDRNWFDPIAFKMTEQWLQTLIQNPLKEN